MQLLILDLLPAYIPFEQQATKADGTKSSPTGTPTVSIYEEGGADGTFDNSPIAGSPFTCAVINAKVGNYGVLVTKSLFTVGKMYRVLYEWTVDSIATALEENFLAINASQLMATGFSTHDAAAVWLAGSRALSTPADYKADVSALATESNATTNKTAVITEVDANETKIDNLQTDATAIKGKTDNLPADPASETNVDANETKIDAVDTKLDGIETKIDAINTQQDFSMSGD